jgi:hypothetical protein
VLWLHLGCGVAQLKLRRGSVEGYGVAQSRSRRESFTVSVRRGLVEVAAWIC